MFLAKSFSFVITVLGVQNFNFTAVIFFFFLSEKEGKNDQLKPQDTVNPLGNCFEYCFFCNFNKQKSVRFSFSVSFQGQ